MMSKETAERFVQLVKQGLLRYLGSSTGNRAVAKVWTNVGEVHVPMGNGSVEFLCGPPEYHAEIFMNVSGSGGTERLDLARMMSVQEVRDWFAKNRGVHVGSDTLESEVLKLVALLASLEHVKEFGELFRSSPGVRHVTSDVQETIEAEAVEMFSWLERMGFARGTVERIGDGHVSRIDWLGSELGVEVEIDFREWEVFVLLVRLEEGGLPDGYYVSEGAGKRCRVQLHAAAAAGQWSVSTEAMAAKAVAHRPGEPENLRVKLATLNSLLRASQDHLHEVAGLF
jgi:hypothetical protein